MERKPVWLALAALRFSSKHRGGVSERRVEELRIELENGNEIYPIKVHALGDGTYTIEDGRHRVQAHIMAGFHDILAFVLNTNDRTRTIITVIFRRLFSFFAKRIF